MMDFSKDQEKKEREALGFIEHVKSTQAWTYAQQEYERMKQLHPDDYLDICTQYAEQRIMLADFGLLLIQYLHIYNNNLEKSLAELFNQCESRYDSIKLSIIGALIWVKIENEKALVEETAQKVVHEISGSFHNIRKNAADYESKIRNQQDYGIVEETNKLIANGTIDVRLCKRPLWSVLNKYGYYRLSETTWTRSIQMPKSIKP